MMTSQRARAFFALGDATRLDLVDRLSHGDLPVGDLAHLLGIPGNLLAHHLRVLEDAGVVWRHSSEGDRRRRYVGLNREIFDHLAPPGPAGGDTVLFVCSRNSARSQYAAARWEAATGTPAESAGHFPADRVHPVAVDVAAERGLDLSGAVTRAYSSIAAAPDLLVSVCDRANEAPLPQAGHHLHWSIPDPVAHGGVAAFRRAFDLIDLRVATLTSERNR